MTLSIRPAPVLRIFDIGKARSFHPGFTGMAGDRVHITGEDGPACRPVSRAGLAVRRPSQAPRRRTRAASAASPTASSAPEAGSGTGAGGRARVRSARHVSATSPGAKVALRKT